VIAAEISANRLTGNVLADSGQMVGHPSTARRPSLWRDVPARFGGVARPEHHASRSRSANRDLPGSWVSARRIRIPLLASDPRTGESRRSWRVESGGCFLIALPAPSRAQWCVGLPAGAAAKRPQVAVTVAPSEALFAGPSWSDQSSWVDSKYTSNLARRAAGCKAGGCGGVQHFERIHITLQVGFEVTV
jgi:hypothetical protein